MELTIALAISIISVVITVINFALNRKDKAVQNSKENNLALINFRLDQLDKNVQKILNKLDTFEKEVDEKIDKAIQIHVETYHKRTKK
jgi:type II secretory pathway pseudopilin PulG